MGPEEVAYMNAGLVIGAVLAFIAACIVASFREVFKARAEERRKKLEEHSRANYSLAKIAGVLESMTGPLSVMSQSLEKIASVTRVAAEKQPELQPTEKELEEALGKAREWLDEATVGQSTKDLL